MTQYTKTVRMPPDVYEKAKAAADRRRMALDAYVTDVVERDLGGVRLVSAPSNIPPHVRDVVRPAAGFSDPVSCDFLDCGDPFHAIAVGRLGQRFRLCAGHYRQAVGSGAMTAEPEVTS